MCNCTNGAHDHPIYATQAQLQAFYDDILDKLEQTGSIKIWAGSTPPDGWLLCQGQSLDTAQYADLFSVIGYGFGGSGSTFQLPNFLGRFPIGVNPADDQINDVGLTGGESVHILTTAELPTHHHTYRAADNVYRTDIAYGTSPGLGTGFVRNLGGATTLTQFIGSTGSGDPHNNQPPYLTIHYIIKYL